MIKENLSQLVHSDIISINYLLLSQKLSAPDLRAVARGREFPTNLYNYQSEDIHRMTEYLGEYYQANHIEVDHATVNHRVETIIGRSQRTHEQREFRRNMTAMLADTAIVKKTNELPTARLIVENIPLSGPSKTRPIARLVEQLTPMPFSEMTDNDRVRFLNNKFSPSERRLLELTFSRNAVVNKLLHTGELELESSWSYVECALMNHNPIMDIINRFRLFFETIIRVPNSKLVQQN